MNKPYNMSAQEDILSVAYTPKRFQARCYFDRRDVLTISRENESLGNLLDINIESGNDFVSVSLSRRQATHLRNWLNEVLDN